MIIAYEKGGKEMERMKISVQTATAKLATSEISIDIDFLCDSLSHLSILRLGFTQQGEEEIFWTYRLIELFEYINI